MLSDIANSVKAVSNTVTRTAEAAEAIAGTVKNIATCAEDVSAEWKAHTLENLSFDDDE